MRRCLFVVLSLAAVGDDTGLSKGPANPADMGTRCAAIAGRDDRAYLNCGQQGKPTENASSPSQSAPAHTRPPDVRPDEGVSRRYPSRNR